MNRPLNLYEKLHMLAYEVVEVAGGKEPVTTIRDPDMVQAYHTLIRMRWGLMVCHDQFQQYAQIDDNHREDSMTLVERQALNERLDRHRQLVKTLDKLIRMTPEFVDNEWLDIATGPQDGKPVRLLGKREDGSVYIETGRWENIVWSVERMRGHQKPTHWKHLDALPEAYR